MQEIRGRNIEGWKSGYTGSKVYSFVEYSDSGGTLYSNIHVLFLPSLLLIERV